MSVRRCLRIEKTSLEPDSLKVVIVSRVVARAGVTRHHSDDEPRELGKALATALNVEFRESSTTGGSVNTIKFDERGMPRMS